MEFDGKRAKFDSCQSKTWFRPLTWTPDGYPGSSQRAFYEVEQKSPIDWYDKLTTKISDDLTGFFRYAVENDYGDQNFYDIWREGLGNDLKIVKHNMPEDLFREYYEEIKRISRKEAEEAYKNTITTLVPEI